MEGPRHAESEPPAALRVPAHPLARALVRGLLALLALLPISWRRALARGVGGLAYLLGIRRAVTLDNLARALPELPEARRREIAKGAYANMGLAVVEALFSLEVTDDQLGELLVFENWHLVEDALRLGKGLLVATAHFGSWELLGELLTRKGYPLHAVVRPLKGALNAELMENRLRSGMRLIAPRGAIGRSVHALRKGEVVAMLIDQGLGSKSGLYVPFFGRVAATTPALSMAAARSQAPVLVVLAAREGARLRVIVEGPFQLQRTGELHHDLEEHTARVTAAIERIIRRYPEQWLWLHRRWKNVPQKTARVPPQGQGAGRGVTTGEA